MPVVLNFTLDPLRSWLRYLSKDKKASASAYLEQTLANETSSPHEGGVVAQSSTRARVAVSCTSASPQPSPTRPAPEQVNLATHLRQDVLFSTAVTSDGSDGEER